MVGAEPGVVAAVVLPGLDRGPRCSWPVLRSAIAMVRAASSTKLCRGPSRSRYSGQVRALHGPAPPRSAQAVEIPRRCWRCRTGCVGRSRRGSAATRSPVPGRCGAPRGSRRACGRLTARLRLARRVYTSSSPKTPAVPVDRVGASTSSASRYSPAIRRSAPTCSAPSTRVCSWSGPNSGLVAQPLVGLLVVAARPARCRRAKRSALARWRVAIRVSSPSGPSPGRRWPPPALDDGSRRAAWAALVVADDVQVAGVVERDPPSVVVSRRRSRRPAGRAGRSRRRTGQVSGSSGSPGWPRPAGSARSAGLRGDQLRAELLAEHHLHQPVHLDALVGSTLARPNRRRSRIERFRWIGSRIAWPSGSDSVACVPALQQCRPIPARRRGTRTARAAARRPATSRGAARTPARRTRRPWSGTAAACPRTAVRARAGRSSSRYSDDRHRRRGLPGRGLVQGQRQVAELLGQAVGVLGRDGRSGACGPARRSRAGRRRRPRWPGPTDAHSWLRDVMITWPPADGTSG